MSSQISQVSANPPAFKTPEFGNEWLENMHEIQLPAAIEPGLHGWGWLALVLVALCLFGVGLYRYWRRRRANHYRVLARRELHSIRQTLPDQPNALALQRLPELAKQVCLCSFARQDVAGLHGDALLQFLDNSFPRIPTTGFQSPAGQLLSRLAYTPPTTPVEREQALQLIDMLDSWCQQHRSAEHA